MNNVQQIRDEIAKGLRCRCGNTEFRPKQHVMCMNCGKHNPNCDPGLMHCDRHPHMLAQGKVYGRTYCYVDG